MSLSIPATLNIIQRTGRNGVFTVAELIADIGTFDVRHRILEQFDEGSYQGVFTITRIYTLPVNWKNGTWTKLCADLDWEELRIMAQSEQTIPSTGLAVAEMVEEETASVDVETPAPTSQASASVQTASAAVGDDDLISDMDTLQLRISLSDPVKLDATMEDRTLFRQLRDELKTSGYRFNAVDQSWILAE
ncbi:DUF3275 family protein [Neisseria sp. S1]|uniref:DUF3275 family protein n=1 Tax=Neisseria sp. S1 TaxID=3318354 RepID=UPI003A8BB842